MVLVAHVLNQTCFVKNELIGDITKDSRIVDLAKEDQIDKTVAREVRSPSPTLAKRMKWPLFVNDRRKRGTTFQGRGRRGKRAMMKQRQGKVKLRKGCNEA